MCSLKDLLNSRTEILHKCTHRREFELQSISRKCGKVHRDERHEGHAKGFLYKRKSSHIATIKLSLTLPLPACKKSLGNDVPGWDAVLLLHIRPPSLGRSIFEGRTLTAAIVCIYYRLHTFKQPPVNCPREAQHGTSRCYFLQAAKMRCIKGRGFLNVFPSPHDTQRKSCKVSVLIS